MDHERAAALREAKRRMVLKRRSVLSALSSTARMQPTEPLWSEFYALSQKICDIDRQLGRPSLLPQPRGRDRPPE